MAYIVGDGFDLYNVFTEAGANNTPWTYADGNTSRVNLSTTSRFGYGKSMSIEFSNTGEILRSSGNSNEQVWFVTFAYMCLSSTFGGSTYCQLQDGVGVPQFTIVFNVVSRNFEFRRGGTAGTLVATWSLGFVYNSFDHYQFKITIHGSTGSILARKNGAASNTFAATGLNTQATANAYANGISFGSMAATSTQYWDDIFVYSGSGVAPNDWVGDIRAYQMQPTLDTAQKDWTLYTDGTSLSFGTTANGQTLAITADRIQTSIRTSASQGGTFTTATVEFNAGFTGNAKLALYIADGDTQGFVANKAPGHLIAVSNPVVNPVIGANVFTFPGTVPVMKGYVYQFALFTDANCTAKADISTFGSSAYTYIVPGGYASGFPTDLASLTTMTLHSNKLTVYTTLTATNAGGVSDYSQDSLTSIVHSDTVGNYDLYDLIDTFYTPASVVGVMLKAACTKTDAGGRGIKLAGLSGATPFESSEYMPLTTWSYAVSQFYNTDPDTGSAWTAAALNALQIGPKVSS